MYRLSHQPERAKILLRNTTGNRPACTCTLYSKDVCDKSFCGIVANLEFVNGVHYNYTCDCCVVVVTKLLRIVMSNYKKKIILAYFAVASVQLNYDFNFNYE